MEGFLGLMSRYHINSRQHADRVRRLLDQAASGDDFDRSLESAFANWVNLKDRNIAMCKATGLKTVIQYHGPLHGVYKKFGMDAARKLVRKVADYYKDEDAIFAYNIADEPFRTDAWPYAGLQRIIEEADPTRPVEYVISTTSSAKGFAAFTRINYWDRYAIYSNNRDPWMVGKFIDDLKKIDDAPQWGAIQPFTTVGLDAFYKGILPDKEEGASRNVEAYTGLVLPSAAEVRLMGYQCLARGVKGIIWWGVRHPTSLTPIDSFGTPEPLMDEIGRVSWRSATVGRRMLIADEVENTDVKIGTVRPDKEHNLTVHTLVNESAGVTYLAVVNEDVKQSHPGEIVLPASRAVADLFSLKVMGESLAGLKVDLLAPGDMRIYAMANSLVAIEKEIALISSYCADEILRAMKPDVSIARRWHADLDEVDRLSTEARQAAVNGDGAKALALANRAKAAIDAAMANHSMLASTRNTLEESRGCLSQTQHMIWGNGLKQPGVPPTSLPKATAHLNKSFKQLSRDFNKAMTDYIAGKSEGLSARAEAVRMSSREHLLKATAAMRKAID